MIYLRDMESNIILFTYALPEYLKKIHINSARHYAQEAWLLPPTELSQITDFEELAPLIKQLIDTVFCLNKHKRVVSSDFYLFRHIITLSDCNKTTEQINIVWYFNINVKQEDTMKKFVIDH